MKIIALLGKTSTGKDSAARFIKEVYGIEPIVSYATRPIRNGETDHIEHHFIDDETMDKIVANKEAIIAFVQFPKTGYRYCATTSDLEDNDVRTYIIDPVGLQWLKDNRPDIKVISIFFYLEEEIIRNRALLRGDDLKAIEERLNSERDMFDSFDSNREFDFRINTTHTKETVQSKLKTILNWCGFKEL